MWLPRSYFWETTHHQYIYGSWKMSEMHSNFADSEAVTMTGPRSCVAQSFSLILCLQTIRIFGQPNARSNINSYFLCDLSYTLSSLLTRCYNGELSCPAKHECVAFIISHLHRRFESNLRRCTCYYGSCNNLGVGRCGYDVHQELERSWNGAGTGIVSN